MAVSSLTLAPLATATAQTLSTGTSGSVSVPVSVSASISPLVPPLRSPGMPAGTPTEIDFDLSRIPSLASANLSQSAVQSATSGVLNWHRAPAPLSTATSGELTARSTDSSSSASPHSVLVTDLETGDKHRAHSELFGDVDVGSLLDFLEGKPKEIQKDPTDKKN